MEIIDEYFNTIATELAIVISNTRYEGSNAIKDLPGAENDTENLKEFLLSWGR